MQFCSFLLQHQTMSSSERCNCITCNMYLLTQLNMHPFSFWLIGSLNYFKVSLCETQTFLECPTCGTSHFFMPCVGLPPFIHSHESFLYFRWHSFNTYIFYVKCILQDDVLDAIVSFTTFSSSTLKFETLGIFDRLSTWYGELPLCDEITLYMDISRCFLRKQRIL